MYFGAEAEVDQIQLFFFWLIFLEVKIFYKFLTQKNQASKRKINDTLLKPKLPEFQQSCLKGDTNFYWLKKDAEKQLIFTF